MLFLADGVGGLDGVCSAEGKGTRRTLEGLKFGVRGTFTSGKRCSWRFAGTGRLNFVGRGLVIVSEWGAMGATPMKNGRSGAAMASSRKETAALATRSVEYSPGEFL